MSTENPSQSPRSTVDEIRELFGDIHEDFGQTILEADPLLHNLMLSIVKALLESGRTLNQVANDLATQFTWMLLIGREHALRGYGSPLPRKDDFSAEMVSDDAIAALLNPDD
jgi:hypothetical protein